MHALKTEDQQFTLNPKPAALLFKEKSGLANHPLSCHPQRGVWQPRKWKKGRENGATEKEAGELKASRQKETLLMKRDDLTVSSLGAFIAKPLYKITKIS